MLEINIRSNTLTIPFVDIIYIADALNQIVSYFNFFDQIIKKIFEIFPHKNLFDNILSNFHRVIFLGCFRRIFFLYEYSEKLLHQKQVVLHNRQPGIQRLRFKAV